MNVTVTNHACDRAVDRFNIRRNVAESWIKSRMKSAKHVGNVVSDTGAESRLFIAEGIGFVLDMITDTVITCYTPRPVPAIERKMRAIAERELRKVTELERKTVRRNSVERARLELEIAECNLRLIRSRSEAKKLALKARIEALKTEIAQIDAEVVRVKKERTITLKGVAAYV